MCPTAAIVTAFLFLFLSVVRYAAIDDDVLRCWRSTVTPIAQMKSRRRWRARNWSFFAASRAHTKSRNASWAASGTHTQRRDAESADSHGRRGHGLGGGEGMAKV